MFVIDQIREFLAQPKVAGLLGEIGYPCTKQELMDYAEEHGAPGKVIEILDRLPEGVFNSVADVFGYLRGNSGGE